MGTKYHYYIITGFIPVYEQRLGMRLRPGLFRDESIGAAEKYYRGLKARLPITRKIMDFDANTSLYFFKHDIDDLNMVIKATKYRDVVKAFESLKFMLALAYHWYSEETDIIPLERKPHFANTRIQDLANLARIPDAMLFSLDLHRGIQLTDREILDIKEQLIKVFRNSDIRRALACFYQSQTIYYTHLVGSYVSCHSRPELIETSQEEFKQNNFRYQEMLHASLLTCYRGIEALYSKNFKSSDFGNRYKLELYMDSKLPNAPSKSRYYLRFYRQREAHPPRYKFVINMLEVLFRARNRAAHGYRWKRKYIFETFGSDLVDESKFFFAHLISGKL